MRNLFMYDADSDGGGAAVKIAQEMKEQKEKMEERERKMDEESLKIQELQTEFDVFKGDRDKDIAKMSRETQEAKNIISGLYGKSGADDWFNEVAKFLRCAFIQSKQMEIPEDELIMGKSAREVMEKAAVTFTTTTAATAGYLFHDIMKPGITELGTVYGNFYPLVSKFQAPPGIGVLINEEAVDPIAAWRAAQGGSMTELDPPMTWGQDTVTSILMYVWISIANETLANPSVNFSALAIVRMMKAMGIKLEYGMIAGTTGDGEPSDGIIADATAQTTAASMTYALLVAFIKECIADDATAEDTKTKKLFMSRFDALTLAAEKGVAGGALTFGTGSAGVPDTVLGYDLVTHPACNNGTAKHVLLGDPSAITLVEDSAFGVDISEHAKFTYNTSVLRVINHYDWNLGIAAKWHKAVVTA